MENILSGMNLSEIKDFAELIGGFVSSKVLYQLTSVYIKIFGSIISSLIVAIGYLYFSQRNSAEKAKDDLIEAHRTMLALVKESTKTMNLVKDELSKSNEHKKNTSKSLKTIENVLRFCHKKNKTPPIDQKRG